VTGPAGRVWLGLVLMSAAVGVAAGGVPLSGSTVVALVLVLIALDVLAPVLYPPVSQRVQLEEACDLLAAEQRTRTADRRAS
jgi:uncharacterized membrane protein YhiD involved in acid resistance